MIKKKNKKRSKIKILISEEDLIFEKVIENTKKCFYKRNNSKVDKAKWFYWKQKLEKILEKD